MKYSRILNIITVFVIPALMTGCSKNNSSSMERGNLERNGVYSGTGSTKLTELCWKFKTNGLIFSSPAIVKDTVFVGSFDKTFYALDSKTGDEKWSFKTGNNIFSTPVIANGIVYFGGYDSNFYALDCQSGVEKWKFKSDKPIANSPAFSDGIVYFSDGLSLSDSNRKCAGRVD